MWEAKNLSDLIPIISLNDSNYMIVSDNSEKNMAGLESIKSSIEVYLGKKEMKGKVRIMNCSSEEDISGFQDDLRSLENEYEKPQWGKIYEVINELKDKDTGTGAFYYIPIYHEWHKMPDWNVPGKDVPYTWNDFMKDAIHDTFDRGIPFIFSMDKESYNQVQQFTGGAGSRIRGYKCLLLD